MKSIEITKKNALSFSNYLRNLPPYVVANGVLDFTRPKSLSIMRLKGYDLRNAINDYIKLLEPIESEFKTQKQSYDILIKELREILKEEKDVNKKRETSQSIVEVTSEHEEVVKELNKKVDKIQEKQGLETITLELKDDEYAIIQWTVNHAEEQIFQKVPETYVLHLSEDVLLELIEKFDDTPQKKK